MAVLAERLLLRGELAGSDIFCVSLYNVGDHRVQVRVDIGVPRALSFVQAEHVVDHEDLDSGHLVIVSGENGYLPDAFEAFQFLWIHFSYPLGLEFSILTSGLM